MICIPGDSETSKKTKKNYLDFSLDYEIYFIIKLNNIV